MPKRSFPFHSCSPLQMKTHVNSLHVDKDSYLMKVYARTTDLLLKGSAKLYGAGMHNGVSQERVSKCPSCQDSKPNLFDVCVFCSKKVCSSCTQTCQNCGGIFCGICSIVNYDERDERIFCLGCQEG